MNILMWAQAPKPLYWAAKGGRLHKQSGLAFTWAIVVLGLTTAGIGTYENRPGQVFSGLLAVFGS